MRVLAAALLLLVGCATAKAPDERLSGCWIARAENAVTRTMRWAPDRDRPGVLAGDMLVYGPNGATQSSHFTLEPRDGTWVFCSHEDQTPRCRAVAQGRAGSLQGGRVFIDRYGDTLRIALVGEGPERIVFRGQRDGCD